jgi:hypothetical protein
MIKREGYDPNNDNMNIIDMTYANYIQPRKDVKTYGLYPFPVSCYDSVMCHINDCAEFSLKNNSENSESFFNLLNSNEEFHFHRNHAIRDFSPCSYNIYTGDL